jgi:hypothetical protein
MNLEQFYSEISKRGLRITEVGGKKYIVKPGADTPAFPWSEEVYQDLRRLHGDEIANGLLESALDVVECGIKLAHIDEDE